MSDLAFGPCLRAVRLEQHLDQLNLALAMGASDATYISRLERGRRTAPTLEFIRRLIRAFRDLGCPLSQAQELRLARAALQPDHERERDAA